MKIMMDVESEDDLLQEFLEHWSRNVLRGKVAPLSKSGAAAITSFSNWLWGRKIDDTEALGLKIVARATKSE